MPPIRTYHLDNARQLAALREFFAHDNPGLSIDRLAVDGQATLCTAEGGMRVFWIYAGEGEVLIPQGYRTQEGDGQPLPAELYRSDPPNRAFLETLALLQGRISTASAGAETALRAIFGREKNGVYAGDYAGELWRLDHVPQPWTSDPESAAALQSLFVSYRQQGWSTKQVDCWEPLQAGDQLIVCANETLRVRGRFACLAMENVNRRTSHVSAVRRLRYLADTAGGCNPDFDPFRRLPLTWYYNYPGETADGLNWVNSHVVNIPQETSPAHFHPPRGVGATGGTAQREMYLVLDPAAYRLNTWGREASLLSFPDLRDLRRYEQTQLTPGMFIYIPPGTGHRGLDVFVNVLTIPGFKPHNEYYIDRDIRDQAGGAVPYNENLLGAKNYGQIDDLL